jgi:hypothetical protein
VGQPVAALGLDETSFLKATRVAPTRWVTGLVDVAAIGGHIVLHLAMLRRGMELPPHRTDQRLSAARLSRAA